MLALAGFLLTVTISGGTALWKLWSMIGDSRAELAAYKLHVAETYVTKAGLSEQTAQMMKAIDGIGDRIDGLNQRMDRFIEAAHKPQRRTT